MARLVHAWRQSLVTEVGNISGHSRGNHTHTHLPYRQRLKARHHRLFLGVDTHQTSDTEMRNCEVISMRSALWCWADTQHQLRIGSVQIADWKDQQAKSSQHERTPRTEHAIHRCSRPSTLERSKTQLCLRWQEASLPRWSGGHPSCTPPICSRAWVSGRGR